MKGRKAFQYGLRQLRQRHRKALEQAERTHEPLAPTQEAAPEPADEPQVADDIRALVEELTANPPVTGLKFGPSGDLLVMRGKHRQVVKAPKREDGISEEEWQELGEFMQMIAQARHVAEIALDNYSLLIRYSDDEIEEISLPITGGGGSSTTIEKGWSPLLAVVEDGERRVLQVKDWTGGGGPKPTVGKYLGPEGFVTNASDATDIRGAAGSGGGGGQGNFAETDIATPEWTITDQYQVTMRSQKESVRNTDPVDTVFTIGDDAVYHFVQVLDANGDVVEGATVEREQYDPNGVLSDSGQSTTEADGWTPAAVFQPNTPKGEWTLRGTVDNHNGNTGTDDQLVSHVSAFTANKAIITGFGPVYGVANTIAGRQTSQSGDLAKPGDRLIVGMAFLEDGVRVAVDAAPAPSFMLAQFDQAESKVYILQSDLTWASDDETGFEHHFFNFKQQIEDGLEWLAALGTAGQGVTASNGYVVDTGAWDPAGVFVVVHAFYNGQSFYTGRSHPFAGPSAMHPMSAGDVFELILEVDQGAS